MLSVGTARVGHAQAFAQKIVTNDLFLGFNGPFILAHSPFVLRCNTTRTATSLMLYEYRMA
jgi:hypothetical protein